MINLTSTFHSRLKSQATGSSYKDHLLHTNKLLHLWGNKVAQAWNVEIFHHITATLGWRDFWPWHLNIFGALGYKARNTSFAVSWNPVVSENQGSSNYQDCQGQETETCRGHSLCLFLWNFVDEGLVRFSINWERLGNTMVTYLLHHILGKWQTDWWACPGKFFFFLTELFVHGHEWEVT